MNPKTARSACGNEFQVVQCHYFTPFGREINSAFISPKWLLSLLKVIKGETLLKIGLCYALRSDSMCSEELPCKHTHPRRAGRLTSMENTLQARPIFKVISQLEKEWAVNNCGAFHGGDNNIILKG